MNSAPTPRPAPSPQIVHLSMDFFAPPMGTFHPLRGFRALVPPPLDAAPDAPPRPLRAFFSETTSHSMITYAGYQKLSTAFLWMGQKTRNPPVVHTDRSQEYLFTSVVGDTREEDRGQRVVMPLTQQLLVHGTVDLWFMVRNGAECEEEEEREEERGGYHYFRMSEVILVTEFFSPWAKPSIITMAEKEKKDERERRKAEGEAVEAESFAGREGFELCLGRDFFQAFPHLMFDVTPDPASELRISSAHYLHCAQGLIYEGEALSIRTAGACIARSAGGGGGLSLECAFAVHFAPQSVYNSFCRLPGLRQRGRAIRQHDERFLPSTLGRACIAGIVLALEIAISLARLCMAKRFRGINIYHGTDIFEKESMAQRALYQSKGIPYPNMDLIHRIFHLQTLIENSKSNLGKVQFISCRGADDRLEPASMLATLGTAMRPVECRVNSFAGSRLVSGTEHPVRWGIEDTILDPSVHYISAEDNGDDDDDEDEDDNQDGEDDEGNLEPNFPLFTGPGVSSPFDTQFGKGEDGTFAVPEEMVVKRVPMFLNFGNTRFYVIKGKPIAYTRRQLYMMEREDVVKGLALVNNTNGNGA